MRLLERIFGGGENLPPLQNDSPMVGQLRKDIKGLEKLAVQVPDRLEMIPGRHGTYVFIGKQPRNFNLAWVKGGEVVNFKTLCRQKGLSSLDLQSVFENLRRAYEKSGNEDRYATKISERRAVVTAREDLSREVEKIILRVWKIRQDPRSFRR